MKYRTLIVILGCLVSLSSFGFGLELKEAKWLDKPGYFMGENCATVAHYHPEIIALFEIVKPPWLRVLHWEAKPNQQQAYLTRLDGSVVPVGLVNALTPNGHLPGGVIADEGYQLSFTLKSATAVLDEVSLNLDVEMMVTDEREVTKKHVLIKAGEKSVFDVRGMRCEVFALPIFKGRMTVGIISCAGDISRAVLNAKVTHSNGKIVKTDTVRYWDEFNSGDQVIEGNIATFEVASNRWTPEDFNLDVTFYDSVEKVRIQEKLLLKLPYEKEPIDNGLRVYNRECPEPNKKQ